MTAAQTKELQKIRNGLETLQLFTPAVPPVKYKLIDYDGFIQRALDKIAYGRQFKAPTIAAQGERELAFWLERKEKASR